MPHRPSELANLAFEALVTSGRVDITSKDGECHVMGDDWTLVMADDPLTDAMIALDEEDGDPEGLLRDVIDEDELAAMRYIDGELGGQLSQLLASSLDELANALSRILVD